MMMGLRQCPILRQGIGPPCTEQQHDATVKHWVKRIDEDMCCSMFPCLQQLLLSCQAAQAPHGIALIH